MKTIQILIAPDGKATMQTNGFAGHACRDASRFLEQALGQQTSETLTAEFHQTQSVDQRQEQRA